MAEIKQLLEIHAAADRPVEEIANIISAYLGIHPGRELQILQAVKADIDTAIAPLIAERDKRSTKGDRHDKQVLQSDTAEQDQG